MILDEKFDMPIARPVRISHGGGFVVADTFVFHPPQPKMAKAVFGMSRYFSEIQKEAAKFLSEAMPQQVADQAKETLSQDAGTPVEALHEKYKDNDPAAREAKLKDIEESIDAIKQVLGMCSGVDLYQMTLDFGKMISAHRRGHFKGKDKASQDATVDITLGMWESEVDYRDRLEATLRYCCFFDLTSSLQS